MKTEKTNKEKFHDCCESFFRFLLFIPIWGFMLMPLITCFYGYLYYRKQVNVSNTDWYDLNLDGVFTISDFYEVLVFPGVGLQYFITKFETLSSFFELITVSHFSWASIIVSIILWPIYIKLFFENI